MYHFAPESSGERIQIKQVTSKPAAADAGKAKIYVRSDDLCTVNASGTESCYVKNIDLLSLAGLRGAKMAFLSTSSVTIGESGKQSSVVDGSGTLLMKFTGALTVDFTTTGAGGLDTGSLASATHYAVHVIGDSTAANTPSVLGSLSADNPTLPSGYDKFRRVGWILTKTGSTQITQFIQGGSGLDRTLRYEVQEGDTKALASGAATSFTDVLLGGLVPSTVQEVSLRADFRPQSSGNGFRIRRDGVTVDPPLLNITASGDVDTLITAIEFASTAQKLEYKVSNASDELDLYVLGYVDSL